MLALCAANASYLVGLESDLAPGTACLVAGTGGPVTRMLRSSGTAAMSLDEDPHLLSVIGGSLSSGVVLGAAPVAELLEELGCSAVLPFKSGARLWEVASWQGLRVLAAPHRLTRQLENKLALADIAAAADARIPDTVTVRLDADLVAAARADGLALPRVYQPAVGFAGAGTVLVRDADDLAALLADHDGATQAGKLVEFVDGEPVTVNGVVVPPGVHGADDEVGEVLVGMVCRQLTGIPGLTPTEFGSCGNDWAQPPARDAVAAVRSLAGRVGEVLAQRGFAGAFGIDAVLPRHGGSPVLIEVNPRWTASLALGVELQRAQGVPTLLDAHLAAFAWQMQDRAPLAELRAAFGPDGDAGCTRAVAPVSTVIAYNASSQPVHVDATFQPGVFRVASDGDTATQLRRVRDGWRLADLTSDAEVLVLAAGHARAVAPGAHLLRVVRRGPAASTPQADELLPEVRDVVEAATRLVLGPR